MIKAIENPLDFIKNNETILRNSVKITHKIKAYRGNFVDQKSFFMFVSGLNTEAAQVYSEVKKMSEQVDSGALSKETFEDKILTLNIDDRIAHAVYMTGAALSVLHNVSELGNLGRIAEKLRPAIMVLQEQVLKGDVDRSQYEELETLYNSYFDEFYKMSDNLWLFCKELDPLISSHTHENEISFEEMMTIFAIKQTEIADKMDNGSNLAKTIMEKVKLLSIR